MEWIDSVAWAASVLITLASVTVAVLSAIARARETERADDVVDVLDAVIRGVERLGRSVSGIDAKRSISQVATLAGQERALRARVHLVTRHGNAGPAPARRAAPPGGPAACVAIAALALLGGGCRSLSAQDVALIRTARAVNAAHAQDAALPAEARAIALDAHDVFCVLDYSATGEPVPEDVRTRLEAAP